MEHKRKFRLHLAYMVLADIEVDAVDTTQAQLAAKGVEPRRKFDVEPFVHRIEVRVQEPGQPGVYRWDEVKAV